MNEAVIRIRDPMSVMPANRPSPRPGFTHVANAHTDRDGPVVVVVSEFPGSVAALRHAAGEAARRSVRLHVVDTCPTGAAKDRLAGESEFVDPGERETALSVLRNPRVVVSHVDIANPNDLSGYCKEVGASLLVVGKRLLGEGSQSGSSLGSLDNEIGPICDVLFVGDGLEAT